MSGDDLDLYRYTVRCKRDFNAAIERAAKRAGLSATSFVQAHFEAILDGANPADRADEHPEPRVPETAQHQRADILTLTPTQRALFDALRARADRDGHVSCAGEVLARDIRSSANSVRVMLTRLADKGFISLVKRGTWSKPSTYRVMTARGEGAR